MKTCKGCGSKMIIDENRLDTEFLGHVWFCEECGTEEKAFRHVHTRNCYDDAGYGFYLVCEKEEGEFE